MVDTSGGNLRRISGLGVDPDYSPDGERIVYSTVRDEDQVIYIMNSNGWNKRPLLKK
ncbi:hypothetical protein GX441_05925 [bacterium]|nr:hypothetical protein [bacterium]